MRGEQPTDSHRFHFIFGLRKQRQPLHLVHYLAIESCYQVNRYGLRNRMCKRYVHAHRSDFIGLQVLLAEGVYADIDTLFVNPLPARLIKQLCVLGREHDVMDPCTGELRPSLCNALIVAGPCAEFVRRWLGAMAEAFDGTWSNHSTLLPCRLAEQHPRLLHAEQSRSFSPFMWSRQDLHRLLEGCERDLRDVCSIHLWSHLWWERGRRDFSDFWGDLITEEHIRNKDTTYNLIARRFLP